MKKKFLVVAAICASLFVVAPAVSVSAAEVEPEVQTQNEQSNIGVAPLESDQRILGGRLLDYFKVI